MVKRLIVIAALLMAVAVNANAIEIKAPEAGMCDIVSYPYLDPAYMANRHVWIPLLFDRYIYHVRVNELATVSVNDPAAIRLIADKVSEAWQGLSKELAGMDICCQTVDGRICLSIANTENLLK